MLTDGQLAAVLGTITLAGGGVVTFLKWSISQWREERKAEREERAAEHARHDRREDAITELRLDIAALLERDRRREERRRRDSEQPRPRVPRGEFPAPEDETTNVTTIKKQLRSGWRPPTRGEHHDGED